LDSGFISHTEEQQNWNHIQLTGDIPIASTRHFQLLKVKIGLKWYVKKTVKPELKKDDLFNQLLKKEFEIGQQLNHPCIAAYHFFGSHDDNNYIITDFIEGLTLTEYLRDNELNIKTKKESLKVFINDICEALQYLHGKGMVHGDLSPKNIIYSAQLKKFILIDFGHAFFPGYVSLAGGTADFSAPELSLPNEKIHSSADIYSFGKLLQVFSDSCNLSSYEKIIKACC
jgi:serine/threonine protein kinase